MDETLPKHLINNIISRFALAVNRYFPQKRPAVKPGDMYVRLYYAISLMQ